MAHDGGAMQRHAVRRYATEGKVDGVKMTIYVFTCTPCKIYNKSYATRHGRDKAAELHEQGKD